MTRELHIIFWCYYVEAISWVFNLNQFQNLHVVLFNFLCQSEWTNVNNVDIRILDREDSCNLSVLFLLEFFYRLPPRFTDTIGVNMDLESALLFNLWPASFKFILHVAPHINGLSCQLVYLVLRRFFELIETIFTLNDGGLGHEELELVVGCECFVASPGCLKLNRG